ncbi:hypothetical protein K0B96_01900 [Horticoccus luteus]|uniref:Uncharacterized protein n=1 Tax=Horticoccus luteus TaxID=2862869 RepID=A0A8F9TUM1_9BACT|nr:hypothetical protein [Horticoccus luteus]QYM79396.1 hypothetical protein K0B96_01900 [Horticoccus luteus]
MRSVAAAFTLVLFLSATALASAADFSFVRVWPSWRAEDSFTRISEYFTGHEPHTRETVLRTKPDYRGGFYFLTRIRQSDGATTVPATFRLQVIMPTSPEPKTFSFPAEIPPGSHVFNLGLTGSDWPDIKARPVAWKLELVGPGDQILATRQSYLWSKPDGQR